MSSVIENFHTDLCSKSPLSSNEAEAKREHEVKTIGTHSGRFNCDEVLACYMLKVLPEYKDARYIHYDFNSLKCW